MLRQYDSRLARWKTKDPMGQYASPYMAMGNNPVSFIDPSGGNDYYIDGLWVTEGTYNRLMGNSSFAGNIDRLESSDVVFGYNRGTGQYSQFGINNYITSSVDKTIGHYKNTHRGGAKGPKILEYGVDFTRTTFDLSGLYNDLGINPNYGGDGENPDGEKEGNKNEAKVALSYPGKDQRTYGAKPPKVDCSLFGQEIAEKAGYKIPRIAVDQAKWYKENGEWSNNIKDAKVGDHIFWDRNNGDYHTGIVTSVGDVLQVTHATTRGFTKPSIVTNNIMSNGVIQYWSFPFVGVGRPTK